MIIREFKIKDNSNNTTFSIFREINTKTGRQKITSSRCANCKMTTDQYQTMMNQLMENGDFRYEQEFVGEVRI